MANAPRHVLALVTGASSGIGESFARALAGRGTNLVLVARRRDRLDQLAAALREGSGIEVEVLAADLTDDLGLANVAERLSDDARPVDLLVNNAGFGTSGALVDVDPARHADEIALNVGALVALTHAALPGMVARGRGAVVNVSSVASFQPAPKMAVYAATKAFVTSFSESLAEEVRQAGVVVQALCPGLTHTEFQETAEYTTSTRPEVIWQMPDEVVAASLAGLDKGRVLVIPGAHNKAFVAGTALIPRAAKRKLAKLVQDRT
ncbi:MAG TPA: SDR family oxidoreductase [Acidimicrobiales bacterium]|nr:SDR family oxidoreductase [Acidimicrobiales bacterium]